ncbi:hypothetical protein E0Z10_g8460 [Xylaria hypoxylon]|uniref:Uncharacterized protein n=1 Tax=Xylaria hypoxylon TaxID=37992 RepID=A0A4Z0YLH9_9PEZI|nr:hypothetical protein E0Z10_g8460 [Xylaria hypoxylon]
MSEHEAKADAFNTTILKKEVISDLEDRYIKLLESKIAHLEWQLKNLKLESGRVVTDGDVRDEVDLEAVTPTTVNSAHPVPPDDPSEEASKKLEDKDSRYRLVIEVWNSRTGEFEEKSLPGKLLRMISTSSGDVHLDQYFKNRQAFLSECTITHDALWTLFPPGTLVVGRPCHDEHQIFVVDSCIGFVPEDHTFDFICYGFDWNGSEFSRVPFEMGIEGWGGDRKSVTGLPFYPLDFYEEDGLSRHESIENLKKRLIERGKKYVSFCLTEKGGQTFNYLDGEAYFHRGGGFLQHEDTDSGTDLSHQRRSSSSATSDDMEASRAGLGVSWKLIEGAVIVDFASYLTYQPADAPILGPLQRYEGTLVELSPERRAKKVFREMYKLEWDKYSRGREMSPDQLLCCPSRVLGYALKQKTWVQLLVKHLKIPDKADNNTFADKLQLDQDAKDLISKSASAHAKSRKREHGASKGLDDFAPEKGRGLVIMLYGQPGVGKILTAESVAQMTNKPLLSVGVSDIGIEGDKVEMNLQKIFALAGLWEAVLLFDEADVFLEARGEGDNDLRRNAMVSGRTLTYHD